MIFTRDTFRRTRNVVSESTTIKHPRAYTLEISRTILPMDLVCKYGLAAQPRRTSTRERVPIRCITGIKLLCKYELKHIYLEFLVENDSHRYGV